MQVVRFKRGPRAGMVTSRLIIMHFWRRELRRLHSGASPYDGRPSCPSQVHLEMLDEHISRSPINETLGRSNTDR